MVIASSPYLQALITDNSQRDQEEDDCSGDKNENDVVVMILCH